MDTDQRFKRPLLERRQPIRSWATLFKPPQPDTAGTHAGRDGAARPERSAGLNDIVLESVDLGYRVIDEHIRRGQQAAQRLGERSYDVQAMTSDFQDMAARLTQFASDFTALCLDLFQLAAASGAPLPGAPAAGRATTPNPGQGATAPTPAAPSAAPERREPARIRLAVVSACPTEVSFDLQPDAARRPLIVHALRAVDAEKARLTDVGFCPAVDDTPASLHIGVPAGHPPGTYNGLIIDQETSRPVGTLSVRVLPEPLNADR